MRKRVLQRLPGICCPDCGAKTITRRSEQVTPTVRDLLLLCDNDACGARFTAQLIIVKRVVLAAPLNAAVQLPTGGWPHPAPVTAAKPANDDRVPANDGPDAPDQPPIAAPDVMTG